MFLLGSRGFDLVDCSLKLTFHLQLLPLHLKVSNKPYYYQDQLRIPLTQRFHLKDC